MERCCEGSDGPRRASSLHSWTALPPQPQKRSRIGGIVSSSTHISLPPGSCSNQIMAWPSQHGQHKPPPDSAFDLLPSLTNTPLTAHHLPVGPQPHTCLLFCSHGAAAVPLIPAMGQWQSQLRWRGHTDTGDLHSLVQSLQSSISQEISAFDFR